jgi:ABC-type polysaccharide/polyol phosphate transport system ATPase subunit
MDPESTGYENIMLRGLYMGISPSEIRALTPQIAEFSGLGDFLSMPIRTYSSGMHMRLAFSVATSVTPDVLLLDEWLAVGDLTFVEKARQRMDDVMSKSSILVLASHDIHLISTTCKKVIVIEHGRIQMSGPTTDVLKEYVGHPI